VIDQQHPAALAAGDEVYLESKLVVVNHHRPRTGDGAREHLVPGVDQCPVRQVDDRRHVIQHAAAQIAEQLDDFGALLNRAGGCRQLPVDDGMGQVVEAAAGHVHGAAASARRCRPRDQTSIFRADAYHCECNEQ